MDQSQQQDELIEQLSETLVLKLAKKLKEAKISIAQFGQTAQTFSILINDENNIEKIKEFVENF